VLVPSGLAAIACTNMALLHAGDEVLLPANVYGPSKAMAEGELAHWGVSHAFYDPMDPSDLGAKISSKTRLVWLEAPGSVTMEFPPLSELTRVCRDKGVTSALDNTWGAGIAFNGFDAGADIVMHALTKYPSGGGDVLMGSVVTRDDELHMKLKLSHMRLGCGIGANDAEAVLRALPSLHVRYAAQDRVGRELAAWLADRSEVAQLLHPAFEGAPGHGHWKALCGEQGAAAGLFSVVLDERYSVAQVDNFCDSLKLFKLGYSWGGPVSLVVPYDVKSLRRDWKHKGVLVRFSVGMEAAEDLEADLDAAFEVLD
jgi:cystathionine beta-lyase